MDISCQARKSLPSRQNSADVGALKSSSSRGPTFTKKPLFTEHPPLDQQTCQQILERIIEKSQKTLFTPGYSLTSTMDAPADRDALISQFINFTQAGPEEV